MGTATVETRHLAEAWGPPPFADGWARLTFFLVVGYLAMGRSFAYLGLPWFSVYIGEMVLAAFLVFGPRTNYGPWARVAWRVKKLKRFEWLLATFLAYGFFEAVRGSLRGYPTFTALRDTAFNYYPLFALLGIWVGLRGKGFLRRVVHALAWWNGCYGLAYVLFLSRLPWAIPGTSSASSTVSVFGQPYGSAVSLLGLIAFEPRLKRVWYLVALNAFVMLGLQIRAEWVGFLAGLAVFAWCTRRIKQVVAAVALLAALFGLMFLTNINIQSPEGRGGEISVNDIAARAVAPVSRELAAELAPARSVRQFAGTAQFRVIWWVRIWSEVHASKQTALLGFGYGYPMGDLNPYIERGYFIQTPHNDFFYALGYSGWIGVLIFSLLIAELLRLLVQSYRITGQPFGLMCFAALVVGSMFEDFFEAPMGAIPFFLIIGIALAPALRSGAKRPAASPLSAPLPGEPACS